MIHSFRKVYLLAILFFLITCKLYGQGERSRLISIEAGVDGGIFTDIVNEDLIRGEMSTYSGNVAKNLKGFVFKRYAGAKIEWAVDERFSISTGLRFTRLNSAVGKSNYYLSSVDFFYFKYAQTENTTEYFKIREFNEVSDYLGVPFEIRYKPFPIRRVFNVYFKLGLEFNFKVASRRKVVFVDPSMNQYENEVVGEFDNSKSFNSVLNTGGGIAICSKAGRQLRIELGPSLFLTKNISSIIAASGCIGAQVNVLFPL